MLNHILVFPPSRNFFGEVKTLFEPSIKTPRAKRSQIIIFFCCVSASTTAGHKVQQYKVLYFISRDSFKKEASSPATFDIVFSFFFTTSLSLRNRLKKNRTEEKKKTGKIKVSLTETLKVPHTSVFRFRALFIFHCFLRDLTARGIFVSPSYFQYASLFVAEVLPSGPDRSTLVIGCGDGSLCRLLQQYHRCPPSILLHTRANKWELCEFICQWWGGCTCSSSKLGFDDDCNERQPP